MATSSSLPSPSPPSFVASSISHIVTTKLSTDNYLLWKVQTIAYLRGQDLFSFADGSYLYPLEFLPAQSSFPIMASYRPACAKHTLLISLRIHSRSCFILYRNPSTMDFPLYVFFPFLGQRILSPFSIHQPHMRWANNLILLWQNASPCQFSCCYC